MPPSRWGAADTWAAAAAAACRRLPPPPQLPPTALLPAACVGKRLLLRGLHPQPVAAVIAAAGLAGGAVGTAVDRAGCWVLPCGSAACIARNKHTPAPPTALLPTLPGPQPAPISKRDSKAINGRLMQAQSPQVGAGAPCDRQVPYHAVEGCSHPAS